LNKIFSIPIDLSLSKSLSIPIWRIIGLAFAIRLLLLVAIPTDTTEEPFTLTPFNDELSHYNYILYMAEYGERPIQIHSIRESYPIGLHDYEYYQPPLYYSLNGYIYSLLPGFLKNMYMIRFVNLIFSLLLILTIGRLILMIEPDLGVPSMLMIMLLASTVFFGASVTNGNLLWLFSAVIAYYGVTLIKAPGLRNRLLLMLFFILAIWTKLSALTLLPAILFVLYSSFRNKKVMERLILSVIWTAVALIWTIPLFWQNYNYYGSLLPLSVGCGEPVNILSQISLKKVVFTANYLLHTFYFPFDNYGIGILQALIILVIGVATVIIIFFGFKNLVYKFRISSVEYRNIIIFMSLTLGFALAGLVLMILRYEQSEARLIFTALPAISFLFTSGIEKIVGAGNYRIEKFILLFFALPYLIFIVH